MVASTFSMSTVVALVTALLSTTALAAAPAAGEALQAETGAAPPEVRPLAETTISGRRFTADDRVLELLLRDGTSLTLAQGGALSIDEFTFDPAARIARLHLTLERGLLRVGGGRPAFAEPVVVTTPAGEAKLAQGVGLLYVGPDGTTRANLLVGGPLSLTAAGATEEVVRPGFETVATRGAAPSSAGRWAEGAIEIYMAELNPGLLAAIEPGAGPEAPSGQATDATDTLEVIQANLTETATPTANLPGAGIGSVAGGTAFTPTLQVLASTTTDPDTIGASPANTLAQDQATDPVDGRPLFEDDLNCCAVPRAKGLTSSIFFVSNEAFSQSLLADDPPPANFTKALAYQFGSTFDANQPNRLAVTSDTTNIFDSEFFFDIPQVVVGGQPTLAQNRVFRQFQVATQGTSSLSVTGGPLSSVFVVDGVVSASSVGLTASVDPADSLIPGRVPFTVATLLNGFRAQAGPSDGTGPLVLMDLRRLPDNFVAAEVRPALTTKGGRQALRDEYFRLRGLAASGDSFSFLGFRDARIGLLLAFNLLDLAPPFEPDIDAGPDFDSDLIELTDRLAEILTGRGSLASRIEAADFLDQTKSRRALEQAERQGRYLFAAGDVDGQLDVGRRLDTFFVSPGLEGFDEDTGRPPADATVASDTRAFLRNGTALAGTERGRLALADTGLLVIGSPARTVAGDSDEQVGALHADFGLRGAGNDQQSTISVTLGEVRYGVVTTGDDPGDNEVVLRARTVGSSQASSGNGSVLASTDLFNTAAGGGNEQVQGESSASRAGYFVIENFEPGVGPASAGGFERPMGQDAAEPDGQFALLRLATGIRSEDMSLSQDERQPEVLNGFAAALAEIESGGAPVDVAAIDTGQTPAGLRLELDPRTNRVEASYGLGNFGTLTFGGLVGDGSRGGSAYIDGDRFAARTIGRGSDVAMVSGDVLRQAADAPGSNANLKTRDFLNAMPRSADLKWGFFFGDVDTGGGDRLRQHVHLGTWVAGNVPPDGSRLPTSGTARYEGGAIGNVINAGALYSAAGRYSNTWDFGSRAGTTALDFDGARMTGFTQQQGNRAVFQGALTGAGRTAGIVGSFLDGPAGVPPPGQIGRFSISGRDYGAAGVFGATKRD